MKRTMWTVVAALGLLTGLQRVATAQADLAWMDPYDVTWTSCSKDAAGSMPLGNGEVGINLWVEENGDLQFYISRTDSLSEASRVLKVGKVRVALSPNPFAGTGPFQQKLIVREGVCRITAGEGDRQVALRIFVDSDHPVIHCIGESAAPVAVKATAECWRTERRAIDKGEEMNSSWTLRGAPSDVFESADVLAKDIGDAATWYHRNEESAVPTTLKVQSLESEAAKVRDPLLHRTFGGWMAGEGFKPDGERVLATAGPVKSFALRVAAPSLQCEAPQQWIEAARQAAHASADSVAAIRRTAAWWEQFWMRSWVIASNERGAGVMGQNVTRGYLLQRYAQACGGRGTFPIKFNGGIFTVEPKAMGKPFNADWRAWGDCYWWQNVRHMYHPMLAAGDFEMMQPLFAMYEAARPLAEARSRIYHNVQGAYFPETMTIWGTYANGDYGWKRDGLQPKDVQCPWWALAWNQGPELVALLLDRWDYTGDEAFLKNQALPMAESVLRYFDTRFRKDSAGHIVLDPTQAVETLWHGVINDMPSTAGLKNITARLGALPEGLVSAEQRAFFAKMRAACPAIPTEEVQVDGRATRRLAPAEKYAPQRSNCENPELYAIWPFRLYGVGKPGLDEAKLAYAQRANHLDAGWGYDGNCAAVLGLADEAARILLVKCANSHPAYRWPATWGPNFDWLPDQNHGGNLLETTQLMLMQADGAKIRLLPAWPRSWDVEFKLHAPQRTVVECVYRTGKIERLKVTPESRRADVILPEGVTAD